MKKTDLKKNKKIVLVAINYSYPDINSKFKFISLAPILLKSNLKKSNELSAQNIKILQFNIRDKAKNIVQEILKLKPAVVGFSSYIWNENLVLESVKELKRLNKDIFTFLGGPQASDNSDQILRNNKDVNIIFIEESEQSFVDFVNKFISYKEDAGKFAKSKELIKIKGIKYFNKNLVFTGNAKKNKIQNNSSYILDSELFSEVVPKQGYALTYESSRGCPFSCNYCKWGKEKVQSYPLKQIKEELKILLRCKNLKLIYFADGCFLYDHARAISILRWIKKHNKKNTTIHLGLNPLQLNKKIIKELKKNACSFYEFGIQSFNTRALKLMNRNISIKTLNKKLKLIKGLSNRNNIRFGIIYGLPGDNIQGLIYTINKLLDLKRVAITINKLLLLPNSFFSNNKKKFGIVTEKNNPYSVAYTKSFSKKDMEHAKRIAYYVNLHNQNKNLQFATNFIARYSISNIFKKRPNYLKMVYNYFSFIENKANIRNGKNYKDLEISTAEVYKLTNYMDSLISLKKYRIKIIFLSFQFFLFALLGLEKNNFKKDGLENKLNTNFDIKQTIK